MATHMPTGVIVVPGDIVEIRVGNHIRKGTVDYAACNTLLPVANWQINLTDPVAGPVVWKQQFDGGTFKKIKVRQ